MRARNSWSRYNIRMTTEYDALVAKVSAFVAAAETRRRAALQCHKGCASCCHAWLTVSAVEASAIRGALARLSTDERAQIRARGEAELQREQEGEHNARCAMLNDDDSCAIYEGRPLVCRTQGHALRYASDVVPEAMVRARVQGGALTWCSLNYREDPPRAPDVLDAERVDQLLSLVNLRYVGGDRARALQRFALSALASNSEPEPT